MPTPATLELVQLIARLDSTRAGQWAHHFDWREASPVAADGSTRQFYRVAGESISHLLMFREPWTGALPDRVLSEFLEAQGISASRILDTDPQAGVALLTDLGDHRADKLLAQEPGLQQQIYNEATDQLAAFHVPAASCPAGIPPEGLRFDFDTFVSELNLTRTMLFESLLDEPIDEAAWQKTLPADLRDLGEDAAVLCHRDFHVRNWMVVDNDEASTVALIDYQDARLGPRAYDLVSYLFDAYAPLDDAFREGLLSRYQAATGFAVSLADSTFRVMAWQRNVKAMGSFAKFFVERRQSSHLAFLSPAVDLIQSHVREAAPALDAWADLVSLPTLALRIAEKLDALGLSP